MLRATGFTTIGTFQRFVLPLNPLYLGVFRIRSRPEPLSVARAEGLQDTSVAEALRTLRPGAQFRVERSLELYATRLGGEAILGAIRRAGYRTDRRRPEVSVTTKARLMLSALLHLGRTRSGRTRGAAGAA